MSQAEPAPKLPKNTRLVLDLVSAQPLGQHVPAHEVYAAARRRQVSIGVSTVYRALERLCAAGLVHAVRVPGATSVLYEPARTGHAHFLCSGCGDVADIDYDLPAGDIAGLNARHGLAIRSAALTFSGLCGRCAPATPGRSGR